MDHFLFLSYGNKRQAPPRLYTKVGSLRWKIWGSGFFLFFFLWAECILFFSFREARSKLSSFILFVFFTLFPLHSIQDHVFHLVGRSLFIQTKLCRVFTFLPLLLMFPFSRMPFFFSLCSLSHSYFLRSGVISHGKLVLSPLSRSTLDVSPQNCHQLTTLIQMIISSCVCCLHWPINALPMCPRTVGDPSESSVVSTVTLGSIFWINKIMYECNALRVVMLVTSFYNLLSSFTFSNPISLLALVCEWGCCVDAWSTFRL